MTTLRIQKKQAHNGRIYLEETNLAKILHSQYIRNPTPIIRKQKFKCVKYLIIHYTKENIQINNMNMKKKFIIFSYQ